MTVYVLRTEGALEYTSVVAMVTFGSLAIERKASRGNRNNREREREKEREKEKEIKREKGREKKRERARVAQAQALVATSERIKLHLSGQW